MQCSSAKIRRGWFASLLVLTALTLSGCLFPSEAPTRYFLLGYTPEGNTGPVTTTGDPRIDASVVVEEATVAPLYDRRQIVRRPEAPEIILLNRDLWAISPSEAVREAIYSRIREAHLFADVNRSARTVSDPYIIRTEIDLLEYRCCGDTPGADFEIELTLIDPTGGIVTRHRSATSDEVSPSVTDFVLTVNERLVAAIAAFISEIQSAEP